MTMVTEQRAKRWILFDEQMPELNRPLWLLWSYPGTYFDGRINLGHWGGRTYHGMNIIESPFCGSAMPTHWCYQEELPKLERNLENATNNGTERKTAEIHWQ